MKRVFLLLSLIGFCFNPVQTMQSEVKAKREFDQELLQKKLKKLPRNLQGVVKGFLVEPKRQYTETICVHYGLVPALMSHESRECLMRLRETLFRSKEGIGAGLKWEIYHINEGCAEKYCCKWKLSFCKDKDQFDLFEVTQHVRNNPDHFVFIEFKDTITAHVHASHREILKQLSLEQINFISDLFKAWLTINHKRDISYTVNSKPLDLLSLNGKQRDIFYSLPLEVQRNLQRNYGLTKTCPQVCSDVVKRKLPWSAAVLDGLERVYTSNNVLAKGARVAAKTALLCYGLKWAAGSKLLQNRNVALLKLLKHKNKLSAGTAALFAAQEFYGAKFSDYVAKKSKRFDRMRSLMRKRMRVCLV